MCPRMICNRYSPTRASSDSLLLCFVCACLTRLPALRVRLLVFLLPVLRRRRRCGHCTVRCHSSPHLLRLLSACSCVDAASSPRGLALMHCGASFIGTDSAASPPSPPARVVLCRRLTLIILSRFPPLRAPLPHNFILRSEGIRVPGKRVFVCGRGVGGASTASISRESRHVCFCGWAGMGARMRACIRPSVPVRIDQPASTCT